MSRRALGRSLWCGCLLAAAFATDEAVPEESVCLLQTALQRKKATFSVETMRIEDAGDGLDLKVLRNAATGESVDVAYTQGGRVDSIRLKSPVTGGVRELVYSSGRNSTKFLHHMWTGVNGLLIPFANRIANSEYVLDGKSYHLDRRMHGFVLGQPMQVVSEEQGTESASLTLSYEFNTAKDGQAESPGYPFPLLVQVRYTLDASGLSITTTATNTATAGGPLPFFMGMHPYFLVTDLSKSAVVVDPCSGWNRIEVDADMIPTLNTSRFTGFRGEPIGGTFDKPTHWDDGFKALASSAECPVLKTEIYDPGTGDSSVLWMNSPEFKWVQVYTGSTPGDGQMVAVEPMSGETDAFNNGQAVEMLLQAGERWQGSFGFKLLAPSDAALRRTRLTT